MFEQNNKKQHNTVPREYKIEPMNRTKYNKFYIFCFIFLLWWNNLQQHIEHCQVQEIRDFVFLNNQKNYKEQNPRRRKKS